jgi:peptide deformylase
MNKPSLLDNNYPLLKKRSLEVNKFDDELKDICRVMIGAMTSVGVPSISAVQVGKLERVIAFVASNKEVQDKIVVMVNPKIIERSDEGDFNRRYNFEGIYGDREDFAKEIVVEYQQTDGKKKTAYLEDVNSVWVQRQIQYLDGLK